MSVNKVYYGDEVIMDISDSTVTEDTLIKGTTAYDMTGRKIEGELEPVLYTEQELTDDQKSQARTNIGAASQNEVDKSISDLSGEIADAVTTATNKATEAGNSASAAEQAKVDAEAARDEAVAAGKDREPLLVNITNNGDGTGSADKTFAEIVEAILNGREIQTWCDGGLLPKVYDSSDFLCWNLTESYSEDGEQMSGIVQLLFMLDRENNVTIDMFATDFLSVDRVNGLIDEKLNSLNATGVVY